MICTKIKAELLLFVYTQGQKQGWLSPRMSTLVLPQATDEAHQTVSASLLFMYTYFFKLSNVGFKRWIQARSKLYLNVDSTLSTRPKSARPIQGNHKFKIQHQILKPYLSPWTSVKSQNQWGKVNCGEDFDELVLPMWMLQVCFQNSTARKRMRQEKGNRHSRYQPTTCVTLDSRCHA